MCQAKPSISGGWAQDCEYRWRHSAWEVLPPDRASFVFTTGANWVLNFDRFRELAPQVDPEVVQSFLLDARRRRTHIPATEASSPCLFCTINLNREKGDWCCDCLDDLRHKHHILHELLCFYSLQETDNWTTSAMNVPGYTL